MEKEGDTMKYKTIFPVSTIVLVLLALSATHPCLCQQAAEVGDPLSQWSNTANKKAIVSFVSQVSDPGSKSFVRASDRIAVFDMDGTIICERPLWIEMNVAQDYLYGKLKEDPELLKIPIYKTVEAYHEDPLDPERIQALMDYAELIMTYAFAGWAQQGYMEYVRLYIQNEQNPDYNIPLKETFYRPMLELIDFLLSKEFQVYVVSGSEQSLIWSVCDGTVPLGKSNQIGTRMELHPSYECQGLFVRGSVYLKPKNLKDGKTQSIYYHIGKRPIFAFGNTNDDFDMLSYASTNSPHIALLLDHDDQRREYDYPCSTTKQAWREVAHTNQWCWVSMREDFKSVFVSNGDHTIR